MAMSSSSPSRSLLPVGIVGSGRMAQALGASLVSRGAAVRAIAGRDPARAEEARAFIGAEFSVAVEQLPQYAPLLLIAVSDSAIADVAAILADAAGLPRVVLHTSGAVGPIVLDLLRERGVETGVLHPLQTVPSRERGVATLPGATYGYCGDGLASDQALHLIEALGGHPLPVEPARWAHYHAASVMACNYQATLLDAALELMQQAGVGRDDALAALGPIVRATTENLLEMGPEAALTGPIRRGDAVTVQRHLNALQSASPDTRRLYASAAKSTLVLAQRAGLPAESAKPVAALLDESSSI